MSAGGIELIVAGALWLLFVYTHAVRGTLKGKLSRLDAFVTGIIWTLFIVGFVTV